MIRQRVLMRPLLVAGLATPLLLSGVLRADTGEWQAPPILSLEADRTEVIAGESVKLSWAALHANGCRASGGWSGQRGTEGVERSLALHEAGVQAFLLTCFNDSGVREALIRVTVSALEPAFKPAQAPANMVTLDMADLEVPVTAPEPSASPDTNHEADAEPRTGVPDLSSADVEQPDVPLPADALALSDQTEAEPVIVDLRAEADALALGGSTRLHWRASGDPECMASGTWQGVRPASGSALTGELLDTAEFTLTCRGAGGTDSATVAIKVARPDPPQIVLVADAEQVPIGGTTTLRWSVRGAERCQAEGSWQGNRPVAGSETLDNLLADSTFRLVCTSPAGSTVARVSVQVGSGAVANRETALP